MKQNKSIQFSEYQKEARAEAAYDASVRDQQRERIRDERATRSNRFRNTVDEIAFVMPPLMVVVGLIFGIFGR